MRCTLQRSGPNSDAPLDLARLRRYLAASARRSFLAGAFALLCACSGGGTGGPLASAPTIAPTASSGNAQNVALGSRPVRALLPVITGISGALTFPAVRTPVTVSVSVSATAPAPGTVLPAESRRQKAGDASGTLTVYEYITIESPLAITLPSLPAITLTFPASTALGGQSIFYGISDLDDRGGLVSFDTHGPATVQAQTVYFPAIPTPIAFVAKHAYTFVVYDSPFTSTSGVKIYVATADGIVAYDANGIVTSPKITAGLSAPFGLAFASGKLYAANFGNNTVTTYDADGARTTPTIAAGLLQPDAVAIDAKGKIYVSSYGDFNGGSITTYTPSGARTTPTITAGLLGPAGVAVDAAGSIYVANDIGADLTVYAANGSRSGSIVAGIDGPEAVATDAAGKLYVANFGSSTITTYKADGSQTSPTITAGIDRPGAIALDDAGKIYVLNANNTITTYNPDGTPSTPTIGGLHSPAGLAVQTIH